MDIGAGVRLKIDTYANLIGANALSFSPASVDKGESGELGLASDTGNLVMADSVSTFKTFSLSPAGGAGEIQYSDGTNFVATSEFTITNPSSVRTMTIQKTLGGYAKVRSSSLGADVVLQSADTNTTITWTASDSANSLISNSNSNFVVANVGSGQVLINDVECYSAGGVIRLGVGRINPLFSVDILSTVPIIGLENSNNSDADEGRVSQFLFRGRQSGGEVSTLARLIATHNGSSDDEKGNLIFQVNFGNEGDSPTEVARMTSNLAMGVGHTEPPSRLTVTKDVTGTFNIDDDNAQLLLTGDTNKNLRLGLSFDTSDGVGKIQAGEAGVGGLPLALNSAGGNVSIGSIFALSKAHVSADATTTTWITDSGKSQLLLTGKTDQLFRLALSVDTTEGVGKIQSAYTGTGSLPLCLQPYQGAVAINHIAPLSTLDNVGTFRTGDSTTNYWLFSATGDASLVGSANTISKADGIMFISSNLSLDLGDGTSNNCLRVGNLGTIKYIGSSAGTQYAGIYVKGNATATSISVAGTPVKVSIFGSNQVDNGDADSNQASNRIDLGSVGDFKVHVTGGVVADSSDAPVYLEYYVRLNGITDQDNLFNSCIPSSTVNAIPLSLSGLVTASNASDYIELWCENTTNTNDPLFLDVSFWVEQCGG